MKKEINNELKDKILKLITDETNLTEYREVSALFNDLQSTMLQTLLDGEMDSFIKDEKDNKKNGYSSKNKTIKTPTGEVTISMPRDRKSEFTPTIINKRQRVIDDFSDLCILLYSKGNSIEDIKDIIENTYKVKLSKTLISDLISRISKEVDAWNTRKLKKLYTFMMIDCLYCNVKINHKSTKVAVYVIVGIDIKGRKEIVGIWISDSSESATFWTNVFEDLKERGVEDILYIAMDGLSGLEVAIEKIYPCTKIQRCIVHLVRNLYSVCNKKDCKEVIVDYKKIYTSSNAIEAKEYYNEFIKKHDNKDKVIKKVKSHMEYILPLYEEDPLIRKLIYTTNAIESVNSSLRKVTRGKGMFINKESLYKVLYLRIQTLEKKWSKGIEDWYQILNILIEQYEDRITKYILNK